MAGEISVVDLDRRLVEMRSDSNQAFHQLRNEMTGALGKLDLAVDELRIEIGHGYVPTRLWEEVRRSQGERIGAAEQRLAKVEEGAAARAELLARDIDAMRELLARELKERDNASRADRRLIFTALVAPFIMLVVGLVVAAQLGP